MPLENPKYDVAISFLSRDEAIAAAIHQKLSEGLKVFFYPRNQEELAGTDGLESMRKPFFDDSRVMVVLYQDPWGTTPWTRVEETAIKEACLEHGWERLFFIVLERANPLPIWLPQNLVRFNYADFGLEQAVGAIKARVQENGGQHLPLTPIKRAEIFKEEERFRQDKSRMNSGEGIEKVLDNVRLLFQEIEKHCIDINTQNSLHIKCGSDLKERSRPQTCVMTDGRVSMAVAWYQEFSNALDNSALVISEYKGQLMIPGEVHRIYFNQPRPLSETKYSPDLSRAREYGWSQAHKTDFFSSAVLAERCVIRFLDLANKHAAGR
jgi:TIR domain